VVGASLVREVDISLCVGFCEASGLKGDWWVRQMNIKLSALEA
jgi:hypothetical protein